MRTIADQAELDVLTHTLVDAYDEHRRRCDACSPEPCPELEAWRDHKAGCLACEGDAPLTHGAPCRDWNLRRRWHGRTCRRCRPCPHLQAAIAEVVDWREARLLLSTAEALRAAEAGA